MKYKTIAGIVVVTTGCIIMLTGEPTSLAVGALIALLGTRLFPDDNEDEKELREKR